VSTNTGSLERCWNLDRRSALSVVIPVLVTGIQPSASAERAEIWIPATSAGMTVVVVALFHLNRKGSSSYLDRTTVGTLAEMLG
jgi:hypothetical protein